MQCNGKERLHPRTSSTGRRLSRATGRAQRLIDQRGAGLVEAIVSAAIVIVTVTGVGHLLAWSTRAAWSARAKSTAAMHAARKMEHLRALPWRVDPDGAPESDLSTSLATDPATAGGTGLQPSPANALTANVPGFVDYLDANGLVVASAGAAVPPGAGWIRRWSIAPWAADPQHTLILHVIVLPVSAAAGAEAVRLSTVRTRVVE